MSQKQEFVPDLAWTGERLVTSIEGDVAFEHLHRYALARELAKDRIVLDVACGEGYGSNLLAQVAHKVIGVDISAEAVIHAKSMYQRENLTFLVGSCAQLPLADASVDLIVSFETLEHLEQHDEMLLEIKRVLRSHGVLIISTPDKRVYSDEPDYKNPFHVRELYLQEFQTLLESYFKNQTVAGQRVCRGSLVAPLGDKSSHGFKFFKGNFTEIESADVLGSAMYLIGIASDAEGYAIATQSGLFEGKELAMSIDQQLTSFNDKLGKSQVEVKMLQQNLDSQQIKMIAHDSTIRELNATLEERSAWAKRSADEVEKRDDAIRKLQSKLAERDALARLSADDLAQRDAKIAELSAKLEERIECANSYADELAKRDAAILELRMKLKARDASSKRDDKEIASLRQEIAQQSESLKTLASVLEAEVTGKDELRRALLTTRSEIIGRVDEIQSAIFELQSTVTGTSPQVALLHQAAGDSREPVTESSDSLSYKQLVLRIRKIARKVIPNDSTVLVVSKGDDALLSLCCHKAFHFPQSEDGAYAGCYPASSAAAIIHLEALRAKGGNFLLIPQPFLWWLEHYEGFRRHLESHYRLVFKQEDTCYIFNLRQEASEEMVSVWSDFETVLAECRARLGSDPAILDFKTELGLATLFPQHTVFSPPTDDQTLPYIDRSIDVVAVNANNPVALSEAHRTAGCAVVTFSKSSSRTNREVSFDVDWKAAKAAEDSTVSIILPTYNGAALMKICLASLTESLPKDFNGEIIVVDDASTDDTPILMKRWTQADARMKVVRNAKNSGFIASCNRGANAASGDILVFLNNDTVPLRGWLQPLLNVFRDQADAGAVGGKLVYPDGRLQEAGGVIFSDGSGSNFGKWSTDPALPLFNYVREVDYCSGALLATKRSLFKDTGGFDTHYSPAYYEDTDYCFKMRKMGYRVYYQPESCIIHFEGATSGTDVSTGIKRYQELNRAKFIKRWQKELKQQPKPPNQYDSTTWHTLATRNSKNRLANK
jgi:GT2 family glycosyltransferase/ubiquinone/menaquinone biosynthesis C-methylase UbiE